MDKLLEMLNESFPEIDWENEKGLIKNGVLDSITMVSVISEIEEKFDISVTMDYIQPRYFESVENIYEMIEELS